MVISFGCDHVGYPLKQTITEWLRSEGHTVIDHGCYDASPVDFPHVARKVCDSLLTGEAQRGVMVCGTGVGAVIACNKIPGIRASCCHDVYSAHQCVEHDNVNVGCIGADIVGPQRAKELLKLFLDAQFSTDPDFRRRVEELCRMDEVFTK